MRKKIKTKVSNIIEIFHKAYEGKKLRVISALYQGLMAGRNTSTMYIKEKWEEELNDISEEEWFKICKMQCTATCSRVWREFNWKNMIRFFITPKIRTRMVSNPQPCWRLCGQTDVGHTHIFWSCQKLTTYWHNVCLILKNILGYGIPRSCKTLYLGCLTHDVIQKDDEYLLKILLSATTTTKKNNPKIMV